MAKNNKLTLQVSDADGIQQTQVEKKAQDAPKKQKPSKGGKKQSQQKLNFFQRIAKSFREIVSELKKVDWPPMKKSKNNPGVLPNTSTVLVVVLFFMVLITAFDAGLAALLKLLTTV
ncbi:MAG: preprotein translocase subunit SecE [Bacillota bacterium]